jgi:hypothetical protein
VNQCINDYQLEEFEARCSLYMYSLVMSS